MWKCSKVVRIAGYRNKMKGAWLSVGGGLYVRKWKREVLCFSYQGRKVMHNFPPRRTEREGERNRVSKIGWMGALFTENKERIRR